MRSSHTSSCETPNTFQLGSEFRCSSYDGGAPCFIVNEDIEQLMLHLSLGESSISQDMKVIGQVEMIEGVFSKIFVEGEENLHGSLDGHLSTPTARSTCTCEDSALPSHQSSALKCIELDRNDMANSTREQNTTGMIPARRPQMIDCQIAQTYALTTVDSCILNSNSTTSTWTHVDVREWVEISCRTNLQLRFLEFEHNLRRAKESATQEDMNDGKSSYRQSLESMEKDLARTFPQHPDFIPGEQMYEAMRDVLMAYSHRTLPDGYCQGMNYIVGLLLMALEPSQSRCVYAILTEICEQSKYNEAYYTSEMIGLQADCALIDQYIGEAFPSLGQHMSDKGITLGFFFARWFITICTDVLPFPHAVCFMDAYIREGSIVLYFFILGIIENNHSALHAIEDGSDIAQLVTHLLSDPNFHVNVYIQRGRGVGLITSDSEHNGRRRQMKENMRTRQLIPSHLTASCDMKDTDTQFYEPDQSTDQKNSPCTKPIVSKKIPSRKNWMWNIWPFKHTMS